MDYFIFKYAPNKAEKIQYIGFNIDDEYIFSFEDNTIVYISKNRFDLYINNGRLTKINN